MLLKRIATDLGLNPEYVALVSKSASHRYKIYQIPKKNKPEQKRTISHPAKELKLLQRWLVQNLFLRLPVHRSASAYKKRASILRNASTHRKNNYLLKVDFRDFFPSIKGRDVVRLLQKSSNLLRDVAAGQLDFDIVRRLVCREDCLTIGAPSSPALSNAIMFDFDEKWHAHCRKIGVTYSRYADDLYFSTNKPNTLSGVLDSLRAELTRQKSPALVINDQKTVFTSRKRRKLITGLVVTPQGLISLGRKKKRFIRGLVFRSIQHSLDPERLRSLKGLIGYAGSVEPSFVESLRRKYGSGAIDSLLASS